MTTKRTSVQPLSPEDYGRQLAEQAPPLTAEQAHAAARILATLKDGEGVPWPAMDALVEQMREAQSAEGGESEEVRRDDGM